MRHGSTEVRLRVFKDPWSSTTHFAGFWLSLLASVALVSRAAGDRTRTAGMAIYGASLVALFFASSFYHFLDLGPRGNRWLRWLDHSAIFFLIAGTSRADAAVRASRAAGGCWRWRWCSGSPPAGALLKMLWFDCPGWLGMGLYLGLTAVVIVAGRGIVPEISDGALAWLLGGGAAYGLGLLIYSRKWPDPWPGHFGHHEIWHLFVLIGAGAHYAFTWTLAARPFPPF